MTKPKFKLGDYVGNVWGLGYGTLKIIGVGFRTQYQDWCYALDVEYEDSGSAKQWLENYCNPYEYLEDEIDMFGYTISEDSLLEYIKSNGVSNDFKEDRGGLKYL